MRQRERYFFIGRFMIQNGIVKCYGGGGLIRSEGSGVGQVFMGLKYRGMLSSIGGFQVLKYWGLVIMVLCW